MTMAPDLSFRGAKRRGNLVQAVTNPPGPSYDAAVYREIAPQGHFPALRAQGATAPAEPHNDKLGSAFFPCHCEEGASPTWQSQAGSDESAGGFPVFRPVLRDCRALLRKARNDKSRAFTVLTIVCQFRRYSAGPGCPLPYNITSHCKRAGRAVRPFSIIIISFSFSPGYRRCTCARRSPSTRHRCQNTGRSYCP